MWDGNGCGCSGCDGDTTFSLGRNSIHLYGVTCPAVDLMNTICSRVKSEHGGNSQI